MLDAEEFEGPSAAAESWRPSSSSNTIALFWRQLPTEPPATEPPSTAEPPTSEPPASEPPASEPPATEPPASGVSHAVEPPRRGTLSPAGRRWPLARESASVAARDRRTLPRPRRVALLSWLPHSPAAMSCSQVGVSRQRPRRRPSRPPPRRRRPSCPPSCRCHPSSPPPRRRQPSSPPSRHRQPSSPPPCHRQPSSPPPRRRQPSCPPSRRRQPSSPPFRRTPHTSWPWRASA